MGVREISISKGLVSASIIHRLNIIDEQGPQQNNRVQTAVAAILGYGGQIPLLLPVSMSVARALTDDLIGQIVITTPLVIGATAAYGSFYFVLTTEVLEKLRKKEFPAEQELYSLFTSGMQKAMLVGIAFLSQMVPTGLTYIYNSNLPESARIAVSAISFLGLVSLPVVSHLNMMELATRNISNGTFEEWLVQTRHQITEKIRSNREKLKDLPQDTIDSKISRLREFADNDHASGIYGILLDGGVDPKSKTGRYETCGYAYGFAAAATRSWLAVLVGKTFAEEFTDNPVAPWVVGGLVAAGTAEKIVSSTTTASRRIFRSIGDRINGSSSKELADIVDPTFARRAKIISIVSILLATAPPITFADHFFDYDLWLKITLGTLLVSAYMFSIIYGSTRVIRAATLARYDSQGKHGNLIKLSKFYDRTADILDHATLPHFAKHLKALNEAQLSQFTDNVDKFRSDVEAYLASKHGVLKEANDRTRLLAGSPDSLMDDFA